MTLTIRRLAYALGAEVLGVDPSRPLSPAAVKDIREAWLEHQVLVFPAMDFPPEQHIAFSRQFGELELHPVKHTRHPQYPEIMQVTNRVTNGKRSDTANIGRRWHYDGVYTTRPPMGALLHCRALPPVGGDTWFASRYQAWDALSPTYQAILGRLGVVHESNNYGNRLGNTANAEQVRRELPAVVQPIVSVHPETGRKAMGISESTAMHIDGMSAAESEPILRYLFAHMARPEFTFRHRWRLHDLVMWDNRCTLHLAPLDYDFDEVRDMYRTTFLGSPMGRVAGTAS